MNSDEEKALFEEWGWTYNFVKREWLSPREDVALSQNELTEGVSSNRQDGERALRQIIEKYGVRV